MNARSGILIVLSAFVITGCAPRGGISPEQRADADHTLDLARSYENTGDLRRATDVYTSIAQTYPRSDAGAEAAYKAGLLLVNPHNPVRDDVIALTWFRTALGRSIPSDDRGHAEIFIAQLEHLEELRQDLYIHGRLNDSLRNVVRQQVLTIASYHRRTEQLEQQFFAADVELKKLKDVDLQIARSRRRR
jgi:hypothetical protein